MKIQDNPSAGTAKTEGGGQTSKDDASSHDCSRGDAQLSPIVYHGECELPSLIERAGEYSGQSVGQTECGERLRGLGNSRHASAQELAADLECQSGDDERSKETDELGIHRWTRRGSLAIGIADVGD